MVQLADGKARHTHIGHDRQPSFHLVNGSETTVGTPSWADGFSQRPGGIAPIPGGMRSVDRKSTRLNSSHSGESRMPSSA